MAEAAGEERETEEHEAEGEARHHSLQVLSRGASEVQAPLC